MLHDYQSAQFLELLGAGSAGGPGRMIEFDPATEQIAGDVEASKLMPRRYRKPHIVPDKV